MPTSYPQSDHNELIYLARLRKRCVSKLSSITVLSARFYVNQCIRISNFQTELLVPEYYRKIIKVNEAFSKGDYTVLQELENLVRVSKIIQNTLIIVKKSLKEFSYFSHLPFILETNK